MTAFDIDPDIRRAATLPGRAYSDPALFAVARERVFARSWQLVSDLDRLREPGRCVPVTLLPGLLDEPLLLARGADDTLRGFPNVCTHRGALLCEGDGVFAGLRCRYHGRRFDLTGRFLSMPEFEGVEGFPSPADDLPAVRLETWKKLLFVSLDPAVPFAEWIGDVDARVGRLPFDRAVFDASRSRDYLVRANWALYCDNYLEGLHIPFVHPSLAEALDYGAYRTELFRWGSLQIGVAKSDEDAFELPGASPDGGERIAGYYFWLFPNLMLNVYPWGLSVNVVQPLAVDRTRVSYLTYVWDASRLDAGAGSGLDRVEREDESVVESVQKGVASRLYRRGRYSAKRETGVHQFHRLLSTALADAP